LEDQNYSNILSLLPGKIRNIISHIVEILIIIMLIMLIYAGYRSVVSRYNGVSETG
jgi:TRAP-type C4-dicarboxylate transport system permease small subunit